MTTAVTSGPLGAVCGLLRLALRAWGICSLEEVRTEKPLDWSAD